MDYPVLNIQCVTDADRTLYLDLERHWVEENLRSGELFEEPVWVLRAPVLVPLEETPDEDVEDDGAPLVEMPADVRTWALIVCGQLFHEWLITRMEERGHQPHSYATLGDWMKQERYAVFPTADEMSRPLAVTYEMVIAHALSTSLQLRLYGLVVPPADTDEVITDSDFLVDWAEFMENLTDIVGSLRCDKASDWLMVSLQAPYAFGQEGFLRWSARVVGVSHFIRWSGKVLSAADEVAVLARLQTLLPSLDETALLSLGEFGLSLTLNLSQDSWQIARETILAEIRKRGLTVAHQTFVRFDREGKAWLN